MSSDTASMDSTSPVLDRPSPAPRVPPTRKDAGETPKSREEDGDRKQEKEGSGDPPGKDAKPASKVPLWAKIAGGVLLLLLIAGGAAYYYFTTRNLETTDDAYTDGRAITVSPKVTGYVVELLVGDNQWVTAGQVLARIQPRDYEAALNQAHGNLVTALAQKRAAELNAVIARKNFPARLAQAQAQLVQSKGQLYQAQTEFRRQHGITPGATTQQSVDQSTAQQQVAQGQVAASEAGVTQADPVQQNIDSADQQVSQNDGMVEQAQAQLDQAELNLGYATIVAPQDGWITKRNIEKGNYLQAGSSIFSIVTPDVWVTANFKESQLARMRKGQHVAIKVDAYPSLKLEGHVDSVQLGSGSRFTAFPPENATGNFVKIVQRVPVKIVFDRGLDPALPLPLGVSVTPSVALE